jgi:hypothetical protein
MTSDTPQPGPSRPFDLARATVLSGMAQLAIELRAAFDRHRWVAGDYRGLLAGRACDCALCPAARGSNQATHLPVYLGLIPWALVALVLGRCVAIVCVHRPARPLLFIGRDLRENVFTSRRILNALPMLAAILVFGGTLRDAAGGDRRRPIGDAEPSCCHLYAPCTALLAYAQTARTGNDVLRDRDYDRLGSLGWHYAIDGYAGAAGSILIWWTVGRCLPRWSDESVSTGGQYMTGSRR